MSKQPVKLLDQVRQKIRLRHYSIRTEEAYVNWAKRFILFHNKKHPKEMGQKEVEAFLTHLAVEGKVAASTQNQAFNALLFLYEKVLELDAFQEIDALHAKQPDRLPTVLMFEETMAIIDSMSGVFQVIVKVLYGSGLRGIECVRLRVKDVVFRMNQIVVRNGKGQKDRVTMLPEEIKTALKNHLAYVKKVHEEDLREDGYDIRTIQELLGHKDVSTTMIYTPRCCIKKMAESHK